MKNKFLILIGIAVSLLHVRGENLLGDSFSYPNGAIVGAPGSPWVNNSGTTPMLATNSTLEVNGNRSEDIAAPLSRTISTNVGDVAAYASFNVRFIVLPTTNGTYFAHMTGTSISSFFRARILSTLSNAVPGKFRLSIGNSSGVTFGTGIWTSDLDTNVIYKVVTRYDLASGLSTMWIDPAAESDPSVTATDAPNPGDVVYYGFRQSAAAQGVCRVDDLRVGTTFNDVAGTNSPPTISSIGTINIPANSSAGPISFVIADSETPAGSLVLSRTSSNATLLPTNNIVFGGSGVNRTVTITPAAGQEGSSTVGITVTDGAGASATTTFTVRVGAPSISNIGNQATPTNVPLVGIAFTVTDAETPNGLTVTATSTNTTLIPSGNILVSGTGPSRTLSITPAANQVGISLITLTVSDGTQTASNSFFVTVFPILGLLINEPFTYPDGTHLTDFSTPWIHHSGTDMQLAVTNGKALLIQTNTEDINHEFPGSAIYGPNSGVILYSSFKVNFSELPNSTGDYFAHYKDDGTLNFRGRVFSSAQGSPAGQFRIGVANGAGGVSTNALHPTFLTSNVTYTVVTRFNVGAEETTLWINPTSETSTSVTATDVASPITIFSFALRQNAGMGTFTLDDLKVGTQFTNVASVIPSYSLRVFRSGSSVVVAWPTAANGFSLQSATDLTASNWVNVGQSPVVVGSENFITNTAPTGNAFFRLKN